MTITITIPDAQAAHGVIVSRGDLAGFCSKIILQHAANWATAAEHLVNTTRLAKLAAAPKDVQAQVEAVKLDVDPTLKG